MTTSPWELQIFSAGPEQYVFRLTNPNVGGPIQKRIRVPAPVRQDILAQGRPPAGGRDLDEWVKSLGTRIFRGMFPQEIRERLAALEGGHLAISTDDAEIPWEFTWTDRGCLARRVAVARHVVVASAAQGAPRPDRGWIEMVIVSNPTRDLEAAEREGDRISGILASDPLIRVTRLNGSEATTTRLYEVLDGCRFDVFHYAGHVRREGDDDVLELADGSVSAQYLAGLFSGPPEIVFVNGCQSATADQAEVSDRFTDSRLMAGMAEAFLAAGVRSYVGTLWDVEDSAASSLAASFYKDVVVGETFGDALRNAREAVADHGPLAWAAYLLFGQPTDVLVSSGSAIARRRDLGRLREMMNSANEGRRRRAAILLGELADPEATETLVQALDDDSRAVVWRAVLGLAKIGTEEALQTLVDRLPQADPSLALHILIMLRERLSVGELSAPIRTLIDGTADPVVKANALITLGGTESPENLEFLGRHLEDGDRLSQLLALEGLARIGPAALPYLYRYQPADAVLEGVRQRVRAELEAVP